jgi:predicted MPP superfamily phosphohydrolase
MQDTFDKSRFLFTELQILRAEYEIYALLGNHDHWADAPEVTRLLLENNITVLFDEHRILANGLILAGIDDYRTGSGNVGRALAGIDEQEKPDKYRNSPVVLLSHNPDVNDALAFDNSVDLVLSGHTHGGQVRVPFTSWAPWVPCSPAYRGTTGLIQETTKRFTFVSKGVGCFLVPMRISCPPDIAILRLKAV